MILLLGLAAPAGCSGGTTASTGPSVPGDDDDDDDGGDDDDGDDDPGARLRDLVDDVIALARGLPCDRFAAELRDWTNEHADEIGRLVEELARDEAGELSAYVDANVLTVTEAAADCDDEAAWAAWEHLERAVDEARR